MAIQRSNLHADPSTSIDFNVVPQSPHVVAFRVWTRINSASQWSKVDEGSSEGDHHKNIGNVPVGGSIAYWLGVGGNPKTEYRVVVALGQQGMLLPGGTFTEEGLADDSGFAEAQREITIV